MADHQSHCALPSELDARDPLFPEKAALANFQTRSEVLEIIAATRKILDQSKALMAEADRLLGRP